MASLKKVARKSSQQKAHALRMLLTSGVIRSAEIDPPGMGTSHSQMSPSRTLSPGRSVYGKRVHTTDHKRHLGLLAQWQTTFIDILKEFGKR